MQVQASYFKTLQMIPTSCVAPCWQLICDGSSSEFHRELISFILHPYEKKKSNEDSRCEKTNKTANETLSYKSLPLLPWRCHHKSSTRKYQRKCAEVQTLSVSHWNRWSYEVQPNLTYQHSGESFASTINIQDNHASDNDTQTPKPCFYSTFKS